MKLVRNIIFSVFAFCITTNTLAQDIPQTEKDALKAFYIATNGDAWTNTTQNIGKWDFNTTVTSWNGSTGWFGITVKNGHVVSLNFTRNNLTGNVPNIDYLDQLTTLKLSTANLSGNIEIFKGLKNLQYLDITSSTVDGSPKFDGNLISITSLVNLTTLIAPNNNISGSIPQEMKNLAKLSVLDLSKNSLSGNYSVLGEIPTLTTLNLNWNKFNEVGSINYDEKYLPDSFKNLKNLTFLSLNGNGLKYNLDIIGNFMPNLNSLFLITNKIEGALPDSFLNLTKLTTFAADNNKITDITNLRNSIVLKGLYVSNNLIEHIPIEFNNLIQLEIISLNINQINGSIPVFFKKMTKLNNLNLYRNKLSGEVPDLTSLPLKYLAIGGNKFRFVDFINEFSTYRTNMTTNFSYSPQAKTDTPKTENKSVGQLVTMIMCEDNRFHSGDTYQWYKNGVLIAGATNRIYTINSLVTTDAGVYTCKSYHIKASPDMSPLILDREPITLNVVNCTPIVGESKYDDCGYFKSTASSCPYTCGDRKVYPYFTNAPHTNTYNWVFKGPNGTVVGTIQNNFGFINEGFTFTTPGDNTIELTITTPEGCVTTANIVTVPVITCCTPLTGDIIIVPNQSSTSSTQAVYYQGMWNSGDAINNPEVNSWVDYIDQYNVQKRFIVGPLQNGCQAIGATRIIATNGVVPCDNTLKK